MIQVNLSFDEQMDAIAALRERAFTFEDFAIGNRWLVAAGFDSFRGPAITAMERAYDALRLSDRLMGADVSAGSVAQAAGEVC